MNNIVKPTRINILGKTYSVEYVSNPVEVDIYKRESLWGQIDYWTRTIRIYDNGRQTEDLFETLIHEILHGIAEELKLNLNKNENHNELSLLALGLSDTFFRNNLFLYFIKQG